MKKRETFRHLNQHDRDRIHVMLREGCTQVKIAGVLGVNKGTISREINSRKRKNGIYDATTAQHKAQVKRLASKYQGMKVESMPNVKRRIIKELKEYRSPDEIAGRMREEGVVPRADKDAIYKWLYSSHGQRYCKYLCTKRYRRKPQKQSTKREMIPNRKPLLERPAQGIHWEGDTFVSGRRAGTTASGALLAEQESKYIVAGKIPNLRPSVMAAAVNSMVSRIRCDTLTLDNGIENRYHESFDVDSYFCEPHSPWQKPLVEQSIGLLRRWFIKKGTDLRTISGYELQSYVGILNHKYRKSLGYKSAHEVALERGIIKKTPDSVLNILEVNNEEVAFH
jgi:transposase, IS30 family